MNIDNFAIVLKGMRNHLTAGFSHLCCMNIGQQTEY